MQSYSSAVLNFVPEIALRCYRAFEDDDTTTTDTLLQGFFMPLVVLRDQVSGYAVVLVKAGVNARLDPVGNVQPPLVPPTDAHLERLDRIIADGLALL